MAAATALSRNMRRVRWAARQRGWAPVLGDCTRWGIGWAGGTLRPRPRSFRFAGQEYLEAHHPYHYTWLNERAVEVPVFQALVAEQPPEVVLEVGNVLSHYGPVVHTVLDKYESAASVINEDVVEFRPGRTYELIVSISTLEHVGFDEELRDPDKPLRAIERLRSLLAPGGRLVFSLPVGYNRELDRRLAEGVLPLVHARALRRERDGWGEVDCREVRDATYDELLYTARAVVIATVEREESA